MFNITNRSRQHSLRLIVLFALLACWPAQGGGKVQAVSLYLNVEKDGNTVSGLGAENFRLYLDNKPQSFRLEQAEAPASIAILSEHSRSSRYYSDDLNACIQGFLNSAPEGHWYSLAAFSYQLDLITDFTQRKSEISAAYARMPMPMSSEIDIYDAVFEMLDKMGQLPGRRIVIVLASGLDTFSEHTLVEVQKKAEAENVTIFAAGLGSLFRGAQDPYLSSPGRLKLMQGQAFLQMLAQKTGGFASFPTQTSAFPDVIAGVMQRIATQYRLVYEAPRPSTGNVQKIRVEAFRIDGDKRENLNVLTREGWR